MPGNPRWCSNPSSPSAAVSIAKKGDIIVLTGKGHEQSLARGKKEYSWDEYRAVRKALIMK